MYTTCALSCQFMINFKEGTENDTYSLCSTCIFKRLIFSIKNDVRYKERC